MTFDQFQLHPRVAAGVKAVGYTSPTPIQQQAIPSVMAGRDVLGLAQTGTGKTAAFALPLLHRLADGPRGRVRALVVAPTRELAEQIHTEFQALGQATNLRSATVYGGVGMNPQIRALRGRAEIIVACPGRLLDHLQRGNGTLAHLEALVLDEADHMFDMGFLPAIRAIVRQVPRDAQRLLFSATMPSDLRHLANEVLSDPVTVEIGHSAPAETISHAIYPVARKRKTELLKHLLKTHDPRSTLVFVRTKRGAKRLAEQLDREDFFVTSLQGNLSQNRRQKALDGFRDGDYHILVATDIAARGIDVARVSHVINYDIPDTPEAYTHRIGRTGRAERTGEAFTLVTPDDESMVRAIERTLGERLERVRLDGYADAGSDASEASDDARRDRPQRGGRGNNGSNGGARNGRSGARGGGGRSGGARSAAGGSDASGGRPADGAGGNRSGRRRSRRSRGRRSGAGRSGGGASSRGDRSDS